MLTDWLSNRKQNSLGRVLFDYSKKIARIPKKIRDKISHFDYFTIICIFPSNLLFYFFFPFYTWHGKSAVGSEIVKLCQQWAVIQRSVTPRGSQSVTARRDTVCCSMLLVSFSLFVGAIKIYLRLRFLKAIVLYF